jgi:hypothetical protein
VDGQLQRLGRPPEVELVIEGVVKLPLRQVLAQSILVIAKHCDLYVLVFPRLAPELEIERPATGDPPRPWK